MCNVASVFPHFLFWLQLSFLRVQEQSKVCLLLHLLREVVKSSKQTVVFVASKHHVDFLREVCHDLHCVECVCFCLVMVVLILIMMTMMRMAMIDNDYDDDDDDHDHDHDDHDGHLLHSQNNRSLSTHTCMYIDTECPTVV